MRSGRTDNATNPQAIPDGNSHTSTKSTADTQDVIISGTLDLSQFVIDEYYAGPPNSKTRQAIIDVEDFIDLHFDLPPKARPLYDFAFEKNNELPDDIRKDKYFVLEPVGESEKLTKSFHTTASVHKTNSKKTAYVAKFNPGPGFFCDYAYMPQIESGLSEVAAYYGNSKLFAKGYPVYNSEHKIVLMASKKFKDWQPNKTFPLTSEQTKDPIKLKKLAKMLFWKYALKEGDYNANNSGNYFIDNDMLMWSVTYLFKRLDPIQAAKRNPRAKTFAVTENNLRYFPDLSEADINPWVTKQYRASSSTSSNSTPSTTMLSFLQDTLHSTLEVAKEQLKKYRPEIDNDFSEDLQTVYKNLAQSAEFMRCVYIEVLRFILSTREIDEAALKLHFRDHDIYKPNQNAFHPNAWYSNDQKLAGKKLTDMYADDIHDNRIKFRDVALNMPEFQDFLKEHGNAAFDEISNDFKNNNQKYANKVTKIERQLATPPPPSNTLETDSPQRLTYKKERYEAMKMDMTGVTTRYQSIFSTAMKIKERNTLQGFDEEIEETLKLETPTK